MSAFSTTRANEAFKTAFTRPVKALLQREILHPGRAYAEIGSLWVQAEQALSRLPENERHVPAADATLKSEKVTYTVPSFGEWVALLPAPTMESLSAVTLLLSAESGLELSGSTRC